MGLGRSVCILLSPALFHAHSEPPTEILLNQPLQRGVTQGDPHARNADGRHGLRQTTNLLRSGLVGARQRWRHRGSARKPWQRRSLVSRSQIICCEAMLVLHCQCVVLWANLGWDFSVLEQCLECAGEPNPFGVCFPNPDSVTLLSM